MTWRIILFDFKGEKPQVAWLENADFQPPSMGKGKEVREKISKIWPEVNWNCDLFKIVMKRENCWIKFSLPQDDVEDVDLIFMEPGYDRDIDPYPAIIELCQAYGWSVYDTEINEFWDIPNPSRKGISKVRESVKKVLGDRFDL